MAKKTAFQIKFAFAFGQTLKEIRLQRGLSQEAFGNLIGRHRTHVSFLERGERDPKISTVYKLSLDLGMPLDELMRRTIHEIEQMPRDSE